MPRNTVWFNDPRRRASAPTILRLLAEKIDAAPAGSVIHGVSYSLAHPTVVHALQRAMARGVIVRLCLDGRNRRFPGARRVATSARRQRTLDRSRVVYTTRSARGRRGVTHSKFWLFSHDQTVVVGSANITRTSAYLQWSSMVVLPNHPRLYRWLEQLHDVMMLDRPQTVTALDETFGNLEVRTCPRPGTREETDPDIVMLDRLVLEHHAPPGGGKPLKGLVVRYAQHGFNGHHAIRVAYRLAELSRRGATVQVICGKGTGRQIPRILEAGGVHVRSGRRGPRHIHWKYRGGSWLDSDGRRRYMASDGSENCSDQSLLRNDEVQVTLWRHGRLARAWWHQFTCVFNWSRPM